MKEDLKNQKRKSMLSSIILALIILLMMGSVVMADERNDVRSDLLSLEQLKVELEEKNLSSNRIDDLTQEGFLYLNSENYDLAREIVKEARALKEHGIASKEQLNKIEFLNKKIESNNITLENISVLKIQLNIEYAKKEIKKENYEEADLALTEADHSLSTILNKYYGPLIELMDNINYKIDLFRISKSRISTLKTMVNESLELGKIDELTIIWSEVNTISKILEEYETIINKKQILIEKNVSDQRITDGLSFAALSIGFAEYDEASKTLDELSKMIDKGLVIINKLNELETIVNNNFYETGSEEKSFLEAKQLVASARESAYKGDYDKAKTDLESSETLLASTKVAFLLRGAKTEVKIDWNAYFKEKGLILIISLIALIIIIKLTNNSVSGFIIFAMRKSFEKELKVYKTQISELQRKYYKRRKISRETYDNDYERLQEKIFNINEKISWINKKIKKG